MVDSKADTDRSILDKIRSRGALNGNADDAPGDSRCASAIGNSALARWCLLHGQSMPIPSLSPEEQRGLVRLIDEIQAARDDDPAADTLHLEWAIDRLVYDLYGLTEEEDTAIERGLGLIHQTDREEDAAIGRAMDESLAEMRSTGERGNLEELREMVRGWDAD